MAFRAIVKVDGITGDSKLKSGWIDVEEFHWGVHNDIRAWESQPTGVGHVRDFSIRKRWDPASPDLITACVNGKKIGSLEVSLVHASGSEAPKEFASFKFTTCYVTNVDTANAKSGNEPMEQVTFNYAKAEYAYGTKKGAFNVGKGGIKGQ